MADQIEAQVQELYEFLQRSRDRGVHPVLWVGAGGQALPPVIQRSAS